MRKLSVIEYFNCASLKLAKYVPLRFPIPLVLSSSPSSSPFSPTSDPSTNPKMCSVSISSLAVDVLMPCALAQTIGPSTAKATNEVASDQLLRDITVADWNFPTATLAQWGNLTICDKNCP